MILLILLISSYSVIYGSPVPDEEAGWWGAITSHLPLWYGQEETPDDNDEEIENSVKLMELFPTLKEQLDSPDEEVQEEAREFIKKMNTQIKEKKRYTSILWKGVKTIIDMGRVESNERRSNEKEVSLLWQIIQGVINFFKRLFGMEVDDDKKDDKEKDKNKNSNDKDKEKKSDDDKEHDKKSKQDKESKDSHEHLHVHIPTHHTPPASDPNAGHKDKLDRFQGQEAELVVHDEKKVFHVPTHHVAPPSDPNAGHKDKFDRFESAKPEEVIHDGT